MAYTTIDDPSAFFQTTLYTGQSSGFSITNGGNSDLQPDWIWIKRRDGSADHNSFDSSRGTGAHLAQNQTQAEQTVNGVTAFNSDGFTLSTNNDSNYNGGTFVAWQWKANGGTTASNSDGNITSTVQANTTAGFSIVTYTGNGSDNQTIGHGLGVKPTWWVVKRRDSTGSWVVGSSLGFWGGTSNYMLLNGTQANSDNVNNIWGDSPPNTTTIRVKNDAELNANNGTYVAYVFANKQGYSKFGKYVGNGNENGAFIYTGFKPAMVITKKSSTSGNWTIYDNKRNPFNVADTVLLPNANNADQTVINFDFVSNGFKCRNSGSENESGTTYIYIAFAENPFTTSTGIPTTAR